MSQLIEGNTLHGSVTISKAGSAVVTFDTEEAYVTKDIELTINVAAGSATTPPTSITANPTISVSDEGLITASVNTSQNITPTINSGYVTTGTAGAVSVSGSDTLQLPIATVNETLAYLGIEAS